MKHIKLKALRINKELSQLDAAKALGITKRTLQNWEAYATFPDARQLSDICKLYGCEFDDIFLPDELAKSEEII